MKKQHRAILVSTILLFIFSICEAQQNTIFRVKGEGHYGWNLYDMDNIYGVEAALELPLFGNHNWEYAYNFPTVGFALGSFKITEPEYLHYSIQTYPYFHFPIIHTNRFALNLKWGAGLAGFTTTEDSIGSIFPLTGILVAGINMDFALATRYGNPLAQWMVTLGANYMGFHNGNITRKAKNINTADVFVGLKYTPNVWPMQIKYPAKPVRRILAIEAYGAVGVNQLERADPYYYLNGTINGGFYLPLTNCYRLGIAAETFYNDAYDDRQRTENIRYNFIDENRIGNKLRVGAALANEITMDRVNVGLHVGVYCYSKIKVPEYDENGVENENRIENILYTKLVSRFYITPKFFFVLDLKTHLLKVECLQAGFGWAMPDFGDRIINPFERISFKKEDKEELRID